MAVIEGKYIELKEDDFIIIAPNTMHNIINIDNKPLKLYTIYSMPHHPYDRIDVDKPIDD
jgi:mannose-6-phosphate isomerase-like protein (cupin superfamily)